jgi:hypothetical protein
MLSECRKYATFMHLKCFFSEVIMTIPKNPKKRKAKGAIALNWQKIQGWLDEGYTIPAVYEELVEQRQVTCSLANFKRYYHRVKKEKDALPAEIPAEKKPTKEEKKNVDPVLPVEFDPEEQKRIAIEGFKQFRGD